MSDFFNDLGKAVQRVASNVGTEVSVAAKEQKVKDAYQTLGRMYYEAARQGDAPYGEKFDAQVSRIQALLEEIQTQRKNQKVSG